MLMVGKGSTVRVDKLPMQKENKDAIEGETDLNKKIVKLGSLYELAHEGLILINTSLAARKVVFGLVKNEKHLEFVEGIQNYHGTVLLTSMHHILPHHCQS